MKFYSTNGKVAPLSFREAVIHSLPADRGLYFPEKIPVSWQTFKRIEANEL